MGRQNLALWMGLVAGGYLLGSVHFCRWVPLLFLKKDIQALSDDGNPGAVNVFRLCGPRWGLFCLALDLAKGFLPVWLALEWMGARRWGFALVMAAPALGHGFSVFSRFQGGKCIAVIFGELIALLRVSPAGGLLALLYIAFSLARVEPQRVRSVVTFSLFLPGSAAMELLAGRTVTAAGCAALSLIALYKHWTAKDGPRAARRAQAGEIKP